MSTTKLSYDENNNIYINNKYTDLRNEFSISKLEFNANQLVVTFTRKEEEILFVFSNVTYLKFDTSYFGNIENSLYLDDFKYSTKNDGTYGLIIENGKPIVFDSDIFKNIPQKLYIKVETKNGLDFYFDTHSFKVEI